MAMSQIHRPSALKQQNKKHKTLGHRTKGAINKTNKGRVTVKALTKKHKTELSREQRKNKNRQVRAVKREEAAARKRSLGSAHQPPFLVSVVPLSPDINPRTVLEALKQCDNAAITTHSTQGITHISSPRFKQRFSFVIPPANDLYAILDSIKVSDTVMLLWPAEEELGDAAEVLISSILTQGLPTPLHIITDLDNMAQKRQQQARQRLVREIEVRFPGPGRVMSIIRPQEALLVLRQIGQQRQRPVFFRDHRPHMMAEHVEFVEEGSTGTLKVEGYVRGRELSVNGLIHIPGWGDYQMSRIDSRQDPHPLMLRRNEEDRLDDSTYLLEEADPEKQESLTATNEINPLEREQTYPSDDEIAEAEDVMAAALATAKPRTKRVPRGTSEYQAAWIIDSDDEEKSIEDDGDDGSAIMEGDHELAPVDTLSQDGSQNAYDEDEDEEEYETVTVTDAEGVNYDDKMDYGAEMDALEKLRAAREDAMFPDEMDTPKTIPARVRFQKFRGLQSFRTSPWNPDENLPEDYTRIFQFENFNRTRKRMVNEEKEGVLPGWYVVVHICNVPRHLYDQHRSTGSPLVLYGLLPHEQKMSVINLAIKSYPGVHYRSIKSKERLIFHVGFRRFANCPIFSEHTNGNKHKFARYFHPKTTVVATMFAPITFPPVSVLMFRERPDGAQDLVATGSLLSVDPKRIVTKRVVLSGHPFKVNRKTAVVRYMFFNREDVLWFKPVELRTKWGRRGHIKEPLGTHGHMKCYFDGQLKSQDTVLLNLYKRVFPKWTFDPYVARPPPLYSFHSGYSLEKKEKDDIEEKEEVHEPAMKRAKNVGFFLSKV